MSIDSVVFRAINLCDLDNEVYIMSSLALLSFKKINHTGFFSDKQALEIIDEYLCGLAKSGYLEASLYPYTKVFRYLKTNKFSQASDTKFLEEQQKSSFLTKLKMQKAICHFELAKLETEMQDSFDLQKLSDNTDREKLLFLQKKLWSINQLLDLCKSEKFFNNL